jgi:hypothetical protein
MFQVKPLPPAIMCATFFMPQDSEPLDYAPRLPRRARFEPRDISPRLPLRSFKTIDMGQLSRAPPTRGVSRCNSRVGDTALNKLYIPGQDVTANPEQDVKVFKALPLSESQKATIMKFCTKWWEM